MRKYDSPYMADWFAISMRWIIMVGLVVSLGLAGLLRWEVAWPLTLLIAWNLIMTALASMNVRVTYHRRISLLVDIILTGIFFRTQGGLYGPASWSGILPILSGSIFFELWGALISAIVFSAIVLYTSVNTSESFSLAGGVALGFLLLAVLFGYLGRSLIIHIRRNRERWQDVEEMKRRVQNER
jgi:hypothetical protein